MKRFLAMVVAICMALAFVPCVSFAAETTIQSDTTAFFTNSSALSATEGSTESGNSCVLVAWNGSDNWNAASTFTDTDGTVTSQTVTGGTAFGSSRQAIVSFGIPSDFDPDSMLTATLGLTVRFVKQINQTGARLAIYGNSVDGTWSTSTDKSTFGVSGTDSGTGSLTLLGLTSPIESAVGQQIDEEVTLSSLALTEYIKEMAKEGKTQLTFRIAVPYGGVWIYNSASSHPATLDISTKTTTNVNAVRTAYFNSSGSEWKETDGDNVLVSTGATGWVGATSFTDTDGTVTTQSSLSGTGFGSARHALIAFEIPEGFDPDNTAKVTLSMTVKNVKQTTAGARLSVYGNSVDGSWSTSSSTSIFGVSGSNSGLTSLELLGLTDALQTGNQTGESTSNETITLSSQKLTEYVCQMAREGKDEVTFRLAAPLGGIRIYDANTTTPPTLTIEEGAVTSVNIKTVYMDGTTEVSSETTTVNNIIAGTTYTYSGTPQGAVTIDGTIYTYSSEDSTLSVTAKADGSGEIVLVYKKYDDSQNFSGYEIDDEGAWCWFADPRSISYSNDDDLDFTIIGYIDVHGDIKATQINHLTNEVNEVLIRSNIQPDDHNNPTFLVLPDERIIVFYSRHTDEACFWYRVTEEPGDLTTLGKEKCLNTSANTTYPSPFLMENDPDHIYLMWRGINWHPTIAKLSIPDEDGNTEFTYGPYQMVQSTGARPYAKYSSNGVDKLYVTYTTGHPDNEQPNWVYFNQINIEDMTLEDINGTTMSTIANGALSVNKTDTTQTHIVDTAPGSMRDWVWQTAVGEDGKPVIAMVRISGGKTSHEYYYVKWNGTEWVKTYLATGGTFHQSASSGLELCYSGGMAIDPDNTNIMYCSVPVEGVFGTVYEIIKYTMNSAGTQILSTEQITKNSLKNNVRPYVIGNSEGKDIRLTWMHGDYYDWIVSNAYTTKGYCTAIHAEAALPTKTVDLTDAVKEDDYSSIGGAFIPTLETANLLEAEINGAFTASADIFLDGDYEGKLMDLGEVELSVETMSTQYGATATGNRARVVLTVNGVDYVTSNVYGSSDCWTGYGRGTGGNYGVEDYQGYVNHTITYDGTYLTLYRNGLVDYKLKAQGIVLENMEVGGFEGLADNAYVFDRVLNHDEIKTLAQVDTVTTPSGSGSVTLVKKYVDVAGNAILPSETITLNPGTEVYNFIPAQSVEAENYVYTLVEGQGDFDASDGTVTAVYEISKLYGENVMTNGSFEDENGNFSIEGWLSAKTNEQFGSPYSTNYGYAVSANEAISNNVSKSLTTVIPDGNWALGTRWNDGRDGLCSYKRYVAVEVGKTYEISYMAKHKTGADGGYIITSLVANEGDGEANSTTAGYIGTEWTRVTRTFTATESTDHVLFWFRWLGDGSNTGNGPFWFFDDFRIREIKDVEAMEVTFDGEKITTYGTINLGTDGALGENVIGYHVTSGDDTIFVGAGEIEVSDGDIINTAYINVEMVTGAQVRYGGGLDENGKVSEGNGLRFIAQVDRSNVGEEVTGYGMRITAEGSSQFADIPAETWQDGDSQTIFTVAITDLAVNNYNRNFTAVPYVKVKYAGGTEGTIYGTQNITRSIYQVAAGLLKSQSSTVVEDEDNDYGVEEKPGLYDVLNAYVNMVGVRLSLDANGNFAARTNGNGAYTGDIFFDVSSEKVSNGVYNVTVKPIESFENKVTILSYWNEFVRINNNNSQVVNGISNSSVSEDGTLTFTFTPANAK
ncbi:MAG: BNR repeat-containing protein [Clostridia bacterium]|nr:BNR repeat-containing protein [Clostridia bacterium]